MRVHVSEFGTDWGRKLANTVLHMRDILFDWNGVPHRVYLSQMHPFVEDGSTRCTFRDRLCLNVLTSLNDGTPLGEYCTEVRDHVIRDLFKSMGLQSVFDATNLHHMQVVSSFHNAHCQAPLTWDDGRSLNTIVIAIPLNTCGALRYVSPTQVDVYGHRANFSPEVKVGQVVV